MEQEEDRHNLPRRYVCDRNPKTCGYSTCKHRRFICTAVDAVEIGNMCPYDPRIHEILSNIDKSEFKTSVNCAGEVLETYSTHRL